MSSSPLTPANAKRRVRRRAFPRDDRAVPSAVAASEPVVTPRPSVALKPTAAPRPAARLPAPSEAPSPRDRPGVAPSASRSLIPVRLRASLRFEHMGETGLKPARRGVDSTQPVAMNEPVELLALESEDIDCIAELAYEYAMSGAYEVARVLYAGLVALRPSDAHHRLGLGLALDRLDRTEEAIAEYREAARLEPRHPIPRINLAEHMLSRRDYARARTTLREARALCATQSPLQQKVDSMLGIIASRYRSPQS